MFAQIHVEPSHQFKLGQIVFHEIVKLLLCGDTQFPGGRIVHSPPRLVTFLMGFQQELLNRFLVE